MEKDIFKSCLLYHLLTLFFLGSCFAQKNHVPANGETIVSLSEQLSSYYNISLLPRYLTNTTVAQTSTYDTTGGNNDGFNGTYSFIRKDQDSNLVIFDVKGAGTINRIWTPTPTNDTLDFYIDDATRPCFSVMYTDLFSNKVYPFVNPLCGNELGGYYCYLPIPFQTSCKIICRARQTQFHQVQYRLYPAGTRVKKFSMDLDEAEKKALKKVSDCWNKPQHHIGDFYDTTSGIITNSKTMKILPGQSAMIFKAMEGGRILEISFDDQTVFEGWQKLVDIKITWDDETLPAVYCPVADFFGYAFGSASMQSLLLGTQNKKNYSFLPMPFDKKATIELVYRKSNLNLNKPLLVNASVRYTKQERDRKREGKFYACWNTDKLSANDPAHVFLNTSGKGHYIGSMLLAQGMRPGMTYFFEGDDSTATDNIFRIHGTGSEDYFNGGWYAFPDRWSKKLSLPLHGALDYSLPFCRTGAYRFYLGDKISFEKNVYQSIEHGPEKNNVPVSYTSLAYYYCDTPPSKLLKPSNELSAVYMPDTLILYPQLMNFTVWDNITAKASWKYDTGGQSFTFSATDESRLKILVDEIPDGNYRLYADVTKNERGCIFSLWQGQKQISEWQDTETQGKEERMQLHFINTISIVGFSKSLTIQFKTKPAKNDLLLSRLIFVRQK